jgi:hypothetical protein
MTGHLLGRGEATRLNQNVSALTWVPSWGR